ncbi:hypothetical protein AAAC15_11610 [Pseudomonas aeruginosa]|uniref:hypothetical protein n=1 Tax=Pseudomonas aeruginosa TaxID=287 RepID=UPI0030F07EF0
MNTWVSFQSAEQPLLGQFSVSGNRLVVTTASHRQNLAQLEYWRSARTVQAEFLAYVNLWKTHSN